MAHAVKPSPGRWQGSTCTHVRGPQGTTLLVPILSGYLQAASRTLVRAYAVKPAPASMTLYLDDYTHVNIW